MLIHHFGAETQGFQRLVDLMTGGSLSPRKITFSGRNIFEGIPKVRTNENEGHKWSHANTSWYIFCF